MPSSPRLRENILALSGMQLLNYAVPLVTVPYLVRTLEPERFGLLALAQAAAVYCGLLTDYGFNLSATRAVASRRDDPEALARIFWRTVRAKAVLMLASASVLALLVLCVPVFNQTPLVYAAAFLNVMGTVLLPVWLFLGMERMRMLTVVQGAVRLLTVPALLLLVRHPDDCVRAAAIQGSVPLITGFCLLPAIRKWVPHGPRDPLVPEVLTALREGRRLFVASSATTLSVSSSVLVLGLTTNTTEVGYYSAAEKIVKAATAVLGPVAQALYPHLVSLKSRSLALTLSLMRRSFLWIGLLAAAVSLATFILARPVGLLLWGATFLPSATVLRCLSPLPLLLALTTVMGTQTMLVFELDALVSRVAVLCALTNVLLTTALSTRYGAVGAAVGTVTASVLMALYLGWSLRRQALPIWQGVREAA